MFICNKVLNEVHIGCNFYTLIIQADYILFSNVPEHLSVRPYIPSSNLHKCIE
jgi:hypothetical protein